MCTVTFVPSGSKVFLTSNRDEKQRRKLSVPPAEYTLPSGKILFPSDAEAGGTWFAVHENAQTGVLLNGAWRNHESRRPYRKSRGLVLLDLIGRVPAADAFGTMDLEGIEPFTVILLGGDRLTEVRWDGQKKYLAAKDPSAAHIWSSVTLYDDAAIGKRESWFRDFLERNPAPSSEQVFDFHRHAGQDDGHDSVVMDRGEVFTVSITGVTLTEKNATMDHLDLMRHEQTAQRIAFTPRPVSFR